MRLELSRPLKEKKGGFRVSRKYAQLNTGTNSVSFDLMSGSNDIWRSETGLGSVVHANLKNTKKKSSSSICHIHAIIMFEIAVLRLHLGGLE